MGCIDHGQKGQGLGYGSYRYQGARGTAHRVVYCKIHNLLLALEVWVLSIINFLSQL